MDVGIIPWCFVLSFQGIMVAQPVLPVYPPMIYPMPGSVTSLPSAVSCGVPLYPCEWDHVVQRSSNRGVCYRSVETVSFRSPFIALPSGFSLSLLPPFSLPPYSFVFSSLPPLLHSSSHSASGFDSIPRASGFDSIPRASGFDSIPCPTHSGHLQHYPYIYSKSYALYPSTNVKRDPRALYRGHQYTSWTLLHVG